MARASLLKIEPQGPSRPVAAATQLLRASLFEIELHGVALPVISAKQLLRASLFEIELHTVVDAARVCDVDDTRIPKAITAIAASIGVATPRIGLQMMRIFLFLFLQRHIRWQEEGAAAS